MLILDLLDIYFDAVVLEVKKSLLFFRLAMAILCMSLVTNITNLSTHIFGS